MQCEKKLFSNIKYTLSFIVINSIYVPSGCKVAQYVLFGSILFVEGRMFHFSLKFSEILRVCGKNAMLPKQGLSDFERMQLASPSLIAPSDITPNCTGWNGQLLEKLAGAPGMKEDWKMPLVIPNSHIVKRILRLDIPTDNYPKFNFVGRLLGPRGHSLKRVEAATGCRAYIRGKGSIKDQEKEELLRQKAGYEHLNEPLHILIEAELPASIVDTKLKQARDIIQELLKPVEESMDFYKRQQLRELAMLNSKLYREESPQTSGSASPFISNEIKRSRTDQ